MARARSGLLIIFTRAPVAGKTKTRLVPLLGTEGAARLHRGLLAHTLQVACQSDFTGCEVHAWPDTQHEFLQRLSSHFAVDVYAQKGSNLGERMYNALAGALKKHDFVAITGCDIPLLNPAILNRAHSVLMHRDADAVLGPAEDGGYYLIGVDRIDPSLFRGIDWGTATVVEQTRLQLHQYGWRWLETMPLWDVDTPADLEKLRQCTGFEFLWNISVPHRDIADSG